MCVGGRRGGGGEVVSCTNRCAGSSILFTIDHFLEQNTRLVCSCRELIDPIYAPILPHVIVMLLLYNYACLWSCFIQSFLQELDK